MFPCTFTAVASICNWASVFWGVFFCWYCFPRAEERSPCLLACTGAMHLKYRLAFSVILWTQNNRPAAESVPVDFSDAGRLTLVMIWRMLLGPATLSSECCQGTRRPPVKCLSARF